MSRKNYKCRPTFSCIYIHMCVYVYYIFHCIHFEKWLYLSNFLSEDSHIDWLIWFFFFFPGRHCLSDPSWQEFRIAQSKSLLSSKVNSFKLTCKIIKWDWISTFIHIYYIFLFSCTFESHKFSMLWYNFALQFDWMRLLVEHFPP